MSKFIIKKQYPEDVQKILKSLRKYGINSYEELITHFENYEYLRDYNMRIELDRFYGH